MSRPSVHLARFEDALEAVIRSRRMIWLETALMIGVCVEIWIGVERSAALWGGP